MRGRKGTSRTGRALLVLAAAAVLWILGFLVPDDAPAPSRGPHPPASLRARPSPPPDPSSPDEPPSRAPEASERETPRVPLGLVTDPLLVVVSDRDSGRAIEGARVRLLDGAVTVAEAATDGGGRALLPQGEPGFVALAVEAPRYAPWTDYLNRSAFDRVDVALRRGVTLLGRVVERASRRPVAGRVVVESDGFDPVRFSARLETDAWGAFSVLVPTATPLALHASTPAGSGRLVVAPLSNAPPEPLAVEVDGAGRLTVRVRDADGSPLCGWRVAARCLVGAGGDGAPTEFRRTGADGAARFDLLPLGTWRVGDWTSATPERTVRLDADHTTETVDLSPPALGRLSVRVEGIPRGERPTLWLIDPLTRVRQPPVRLEATPNDGVAAVRLDLPAGRYQVRCAAPGVLLDARRIVVREDSVVHVRFVWPASRVEGLFVDDRGRRVPRLSFTLESADPGRGGLVARVDAQSDEDGRFHVRVPRGFEGWVVVSPEGLLGRPRYAAARFAVRERAEPYVLRLRRPVLVTGRLLDGAGTGFEVTLRALRRDGGEGEAWVRLDPRGGFAVPLRIAPGRADVRLGLDDGRGLLVRDLGLSAGENDLGTLRLPAPSLTGWVVDAEGRPVSGWPVFLEQGRGGEEFDLDVETDAEGHFAFGGLFPGPATLRVSGADRADGGDRVFEIADASRPFHVRVVLETARDENS